MAKLVERVAALGQAIAADISAILAKTNALKTAAYKDVGTTSGAIPEFVGVNGIGGLGYGGKAVNIPKDADLNNYRTVTAEYGGAFKPLNFPEASLSGGYALSVAVNENITTQTLVVARFATPKSKIAVYRRLYMAGKWTDWAMLFDPNKVDSTDAVVELATANFNDLRFVSGTYAGDTSTVTAGFPVVVGANFVTRYILEVIVADNGAGYVNNLVQTLTVFAYGSDFNSWVTAKLERTLFGINKWTAWTTIYNDFDGGGGSGVGGVFSSITAGSLSPAMAYAEVTKPVGVINPETGGTSSVFIKYPSTITPESIIHVQASIKTPEGHTVMPLSVSFVNVDPTSWSSYYTMDYDYATDGALFVFNRATAGKLSNGTARVLITYRTT